MAGLSSYIAKQCRYALHLNHLAPGLRPTPADPDPVQQLRAELGNEFEASVGHTLTAFHPDMATIEGRGRDAEEATLAAMDAGERLVWNASLPEDISGRRTGLPDLLVRSGNNREAARWRYVPVDVKNHKPFEERKSDKSLLARSGLDQLVPNIGDLAQGAGRSDDLLQLAHYWRMLEAIERAPTTMEPIGGIIGKDDLEPLLVWLPLNLSSYDELFAEAITIIDEAASTTTDPLQPRLARTYKHSDCPACIWHEVCAEQWLARDDLTLAIEDRVSYELQERGTSTRAALAELDLRVAWLLDNGLASEALTVAAAGQAEVDLPPTLVQSDIGLSTVGDLDGLAPDLERLVGGTYRGKVLNGVLSARAQRAGAPLLRPGALNQANNPPRGDVEIDIDMEDFTDWCYLWGTYSTIRNAALPFELEAGYRPFAAFEEGDGSSFAAPTLELEAQVFADLWTWLTRISEQCEENDLTFRLYCFAGPGAENKWLRKLATRHQGHAGVPSLELVEDLIASDVWVDMYDYTKRIWVTPKGNGLKNVAPIAGHSWDDDEDSGGASLIWFRDACRAADPEARVSNTKKLLAYNRNDVLATYSLRTAISDLLS